ncbi:MAG: 30S ribosomal protein S11 [Patescibacteria group bacterium]
MGKKHIIKEEKAKENNKVKEETANVVKKTPSLVRTVNGRAYVHASYNNTIITITDSSGNVISWASAGAVGFKGAKKSTPFAASRVAEILMEKIMKIGMKNIEVFVRGIGSGRDSAIRSLASRGLNIISIEDITPLPHNGCRPKKPRRI